MHFHKKQLVKLSMRFLLTAKYWMNISPEEQVNYMKMMREARIALTKAGIYDPKMMNFLKKVRCKQNPNSFECALNDE